MQSAYGSPCVCESSWRTVIADSLPLNSGRYVAIDSSSDTVPSSTSVISVADVNHLLADAIGMTESASSAPKSASWITSLPRTTSSTPPARSSCSTRSRDRPVEPGEGILVGRGRRRRGHAERERHDDDEGTDATSRSHRSSVRDCGHAVQGASMSGAGMQGRSERPMWKVIQFATGNVGRLALRGIIGHPDLELVGPVGAQRRQGRARTRASCAVVDPIGVLGDQRRRRAPRPRRRTASRYIATGDLRPAEAVDDMCRILASGKNVVSTSVVPLVYPPHRRPGDGRAARSRVPRRARRRASRRASTPASPTTCCR